MNPKSSPMAPVKKLATVYVMLIPLVEMGKCPA